LPDVATEIARRRAFDTARRDRWWVPPLASGLGLAAFGVYAFVVAVLGEDYRYTEDGADYLSPFYSPDLSGLDVPFSSAFLVIWVPLGFRATCYYYRKAVYRAYFMAPPACAVASPRTGRYRGEAAFPYVLMNAHRYFLFLATVVLGFLWYDAVRGFLFDGSFGVGLGSLVLLTNAILLSMFTFGCNSVRHLVGGRLDCFTCSARARARHRVWRGVGVLNGRHMEWAWISLAWVALADLYVRLAAGGAFDDPRII
jgi:hypothetical protein